MGVTFQYFFGHLLQITASAFPEADCHSRIPLDNLEWAVVASKHLICLLLQMHRAWEPFAQMWIM